MSEEKVKPLPVQGSGESEAHRVWSGGVRLGSVLVVEGYCANLHTAKGERELRVGKNWMKLGRPAKASFGKPLRPRRRPVCRVRVRVMPRGVCQGQMVRKQGSPSSRRHDFIEERRGFPFIPSFSYR